jgi:hypothetical protein
VVGFFLRHRLVRSARFVAATVTLVSFVGLQPASADITYNYDASGLVAENGDTFSVAVSITTHGNTGTLSGTDVASWEWTATDTVTNVTASSNSTVSNQIFAFSDVNATSQSLSLPDPGGIISIGDHNDGGEFVRWRNQGGQVFFQGQFNAEASETAWNIPTNNPVATAGIVARALEPRPVLRTRRAGNARPAPKARKFRPQLAPP